MDTRNGNLIPLTPEMLEGMEREELGSFVEVKRSLSEKEKTDRQIRLYSPCGCGSGKKFKFCCYSGGENK